ncbi:MAG: transglutaminase domain-containing protein [Pirellulaceae bacterium]
MDALRESLRRANWPLLTMVGLTSLLVGIGCVGPSGAGPLDVALAVGLWAAAVAGHLYVVRRERLASHWIVLALVAALLSPALQFLFFSPPATGLTPLATGCLIGLRNVILLAAVFSKAPRFERMAASASAFLVLVAFSLGDGLAVFLAAMFYTAAAVWWLMNRHWAAISRRRVAGRHTRLPWFGVTTIASCMALLVFAAVLLYPGSGRSLQDSLLEWLYGDDDSLSMKMEANRFNLEQETLEDLADDKYGENNAKSAGGRGGDSSDRMFKQASDFSTIRRPPDAQNQDTGQSMFFVQGPAAVHLPVTHYRDFDGATLKAESPSLTMGPRVSSFLRGDQAWKTLLDPKNRLLSEGDLGAGDMSFSLDAMKSMDADAIEELRRLAAQYVGADRPSVSPEFQSLDVAGLERALGDTRYWGRNMQYLGTHYDLDLLVEELQNDPQAMALLMEMAFNRQEGDEQRFADYLRRWRKQRPGPALPAEMAEVVQRWIEGKPPGRRQIDAVVEHLRADYQHDPTATAPADEPDSVRYFLLESKRGPDYLFATSATVILRSLGYPSRVVGGYYAPPEQFNWLTGRGEVRNDDVHFWTQVWVADLGVWLDLEPTPGYDMPHPPQPIGERLAAVYASAGDWAAKNAAWVTTVALVLVVVMLSRAVWTDLLATAWWRWRTRRRGDTSERAQRRLILRTCRLIERRAKFAGAARPAGTTWCDWVTPLFDDEPERQRDLRRLGRLANWAAFAPKRCSPPSHADYDQATAFCRAIVAKVTRRRLRPQTKRPASQRRVSQTRDPQQRTYTRLQPGTTS